MTYEKPLPPVRDLLALAQKTTFPIKNAAIMKIAKKEGSSQVVMDFLGLFPADEEFVSRVDFMTRSEELEMLIGQERTMPREILHGPQD